LGPDRLRLKDWNRSRVDAIALECILAKNGIQRN
jgi:hypothetical protein